MTDSTYAEIAKRLRTLIPDALNDEANGGTHSLCILAKHVLDNEQAILAALELAEQVRALEEWMEDEKYFRWIDIEGVGGVRIVVLKEERTYDEVLRYVERAPTLSAAIAAALGKVTT